MSDCIPFVVDATAQSVERFKTCMFPEKQYGEKASALLEYLCSLAFYHYVPKTIHMKHTKSSLYVNKL